MGYVWSGNGKRANVEEVYGAICVWSGLLYFVAISIKYVGFERAYTEVVLWYSDDRCI